MENAREPASGGTPAHDEAPARDSARPVDEPRAKQGTETKPKTPAKRATAKSAQSGSTGAKSTATAAKKSTAAKSATTTTATKKPTAKKPTTTATKPTATKSTGAKKPTAAKSAATKSTTAAKKPTATKSTGATSTAAAKSTAKPTTTAAARTSTPRNTIAQPIAPVSPDAAAEQLDVAVEPTTGEASTQAATATSAPKTSAGPRPAKKSARPAASRKKPATATHPKAAPSAASRPEEGSAKLDEGRADTAAEPASTETESARVQSDPAAAELAEPQAAGSESAEPQAAASESPATESVPDEPAAEVAPDGAATDASPATSTTSALGRIGAGAAGAALAARAWGTRAVAGTSSAVVRAMGATRAELGRWRRSVAADALEVRQQWVQARARRVDTKPVARSIDVPEATAPTAGTELEISTRTRTEVEPESVELIVTADAAAPSGTALSVRGVVKRFGDTIAVDGIDLDVPAGSFYGIVGPNGAGKTTLLSMISGLLRPDAGAIHVHGADVWSDPAATKRDMGVLPDRLRLFDRLTGSQLLYYSAMLRGMDRVTARKRTADLASVFGIEDALGRLLTDYSTGMTKKVALAAAMIHAPRLLVLDEPFDAVDPVSSATVTEILHKYTLAGGTVVLSSHSMDLVQRMCDRVAVIVDGGIIAEGTVDEVRGAATLQERFVELAGRKSVEELEWLHGSSN